MIQVFISHSSEDTKLAGLVVDLLRSALNLGAQTIRASSVDGYRLPAGAEFNDQLREELLAAPVFIGILSPLSLSSAYVLFELGARWGVGTQLIPLLAPGMTAHALRGPIVSLNALSCESTGQLHQLVQEAGAALGIETESPAVYQGKVDAIANLGVSGTPQGGGATDSHDQSKGTSRSPANTASSTDSDDEYSDAEAVIRHHCQNEWPNDYNMHAYCIEQQHNALTQLRRGAPEGIPKEVFAQMRSHCAAEWPDDYAMRAYCEAQQVAGYQKVSSA